MLTMAFSCVHIRIFLMRVKQFQFCGYYGLLWAECSFYDELNLDIKQSDSSCGLTPKYCQPKLYIVSDALDNILSKNITVPCFSHLPICQSSMMRNWVTMSKGIKYYMVK